MSIVNARGTFSRWAGQTERRRAVLRRLTPPQLFVVSFLGLVTVGTVGLRLLPGLYTGARLGWIDALFTATSAACVTGLVVVDTATWFTPLGQAFLLALIQLGGLGMVAFTSLIILALGRRLSLRQESLAGSGAEVAPAVNVERLMRDVVRFTLAVELASACVLYLLWAPDLGWRGAAWPALFHAVSAFCNAGFSTFSDNLIGFQRDPLTLMVIALTLILGGLGFLTLEELAQWRRERRINPRLRLSLHSRLALVSTVILLVGGWVAFAVFEWHGTLGDLPAGHRLVNAFLMSATPRTAGYNNIDYAAASDSTNFLTIILMMIGGSPGSTAGGVKTTTVALLGLLALSRFRGRQVVDAWGRSVPEETIQRAVGLAVSVFVIVTSGIFALTWTEHGGVGGRGHSTFLPAMFEVASAFNTVGLSMGFTDDISPAGRVVLAALMFLGRVGPLAFAAALAIATDRRRDDYRYAYEDVIVG